MSIAEAVGSSVCPCICSIIRQSARELTRLYDRAMPEVYTSNGRKVRLRITQFVVLQALYDSGWQQKPVFGRRKRLACQGVVQISLAQYLGVDATTLSRNLTVLIDDNGWVEVAEADVLCKRERVLRLTKLGLDVYKTAASRWNAVQSEFLRQLGELGMTSEMVTEAHSKIAAACDNTSSMFTDQD